MGWGKGVSQNCNTGGKAMTGTASIETGQFAELAAAVVQQLPRDMDSTTAQGWITNRAALQKVLREVLLPDTQSAMEHAFQTFRTVKLGTHRSPKELRKALEQSGKRISDWAGDILNKVVVAKQKTELDIVVVSVDELGFKDGARYDQICARGKEFGLELCPFEVGPQLRLQYTDQPVGEWLVVATEPLSDRDGDLLVFCVERYGVGMWLCAGCGGPGSFWYGSDRFVFCRK